MINDVNQDDLGKTGVLVGLLNMIMAPIYMLDFKLGITTAILGTSALVYAAHETGKKQRPIANGLNSAHGIFGGKNNELGNAAANVTAGGAAFFDEIFPESKAKR